MVSTVNRGMAIGRGVMPNRIEGQFRIRVTASRRGESASATLIQTNAEAAASSSRNKWIAIAAVGGAAVGPLWSQGADARTVGASDRSAVPAQAPWSWGRRLSDLRVEGLR